MATVTVNVNANTKDATQDINNLDKALDGAAGEAEKLNTALEAQENRIKTLGGAINIVGGSVEVLAGGLALTGGLTEEQAERFESAAIGAIAFADGTKRVFEGVKELNEGLKNYGGIAGIAAKAVGRLNALVRANPYVAAATALAAVTAAVYAFVQSTSDANDEGKVLNRTLDEQIALYDGVTRAANGSAEKIRNLEARAKALNSTFEEQLAIDREAALKGEAKAQEEINQLEAALVGTRKIDREETEKQLELAKKRRDGAREFLDLLFDTEAAYADIEEKAKKTTGGTPEKPIALYIQPKLIVPEGGGEPQTIAEYFENQMADGSAVMVPVTFIDPTTGETYDSMGNLIGSSLDLGETTLIERATVLGGKIGEAMGGQVAQGVGSNLEAASQLTSALVQVVDDGSEEAFEKAKKYKIADVITSSTSAAFQAFAAAQAYGPILGPILGAAQVAAIAVAANRAIGDIKSSTFSGGGGVSGGGAGAVSAPAGFSPGGLGGSSQTLVTSIPPPEAQPMRAYVLTGDVTSGIEAEAQLSSRRTFGPG